MTRSVFIAMCAAVLAAGVGSAYSRLGAAEKQPEVTGEWTGTWGVYNPAQPAPAAGADSPAPKYKAAQMRLDSKVVRKDGKWQATFEGECGRPYTYTITMLGRQAGDIVLFQGTADLGEKDGGVYDWIGRATDKEFVGFYTSQKYTGTFQLTRPKKDSAAPSK